MFLRFCTRSLLHESLDYSLIDRIPGRQTDRKTLLGELNWIFTAVTDTIAWNVLPHDLFQRLFRQDLLVASLFRNFLLAERIMRSANCSPISYPMLPSTHQHHMWDAWDMAAEICLSQLPTLVEDPNAEFQPSPFFTEQLTAFEVWLDHGSEHKKPPEQLPIVLQVLLSQCHRFRALVLLGRFLDMGPWAVDLALSVGIFPYVLKLLQTTTPELRQILVFIWTKILALDKGTAHVGFSRELVWIIRLFVLMEAVPTNSPGSVSFCLWPQQTPKVSCCCVLEASIWSVLTSLPSFTFKGSGSGYTTPTHYMPHGSIVPSPVAPLLRVGNDSQVVARDGRVSTSSPLAATGVMHGSPLSDDSSQHSDSGALNECVSNGVLNHSMRRPLDNALYSQCVLAMCNLAKDPSPRVASLGRRVLAIIGIEQVVAKSIKTSGGHLPLTFRTPPVSPPRPSYLTGMRRVCSLEFRPHLMNSPDSGLADPLLGSAGASGVSERSFLPQSMIYNWSCGHFSKPLLTAMDDSEEIIARREEREKLALDHIVKCQHSSVSKLHNQIASWDTKFETGTKTALLQPFSPVVIASDENERIRVWNYEEATLLNSFNNHDYPDKGVSKLCLVNELDENLLLVASSNHLAQVGNLPDFVDFRSGR
ncbi:UNVERIFIED_CONTAM: Regulatory-associated protein of TOR 1 [Sesamum angustifolium]|uniref:Regulatory-associated protein of TOR 1 n=1 Tax=Sesamum angustifolium TaxID=2727405 RepID=A0AAW2N3T1_9LAMI